MKLPVPSMDNRRNGRDEGTEHRANTSITVKRSVTAIPGGPDARNSNVRLITQGRTRFVGRSTAAPRLGNTTGARYNHSGIISAKPRAGKSAESDTFFTFQRQPPWPLKSICWRTPQELA